VKLIIGEMIKIKVVLLVSMMKKKCNLKREGYFAKFNGKNEKKKNECFSRWDWK